MCVLWFHPEQICAVTDSVLEQPRSVRLICNYNCIRHMLCSCGHFMTFNIESVFTMCTSNFCIIDLGTTGDFSTFHFLKIAGKLKIDRVGMSR